MWLTQVSDFICFVCFQVRTVPLRLHWSEMQLVRQRSIRNCIHGQALMWSLNGQMVFPLLQISDTILFNWNSDWSMLICLRFKFWSDQSSQVSLYPCEIKLVVVIVFCFVLTSHSLLKDNDLLSCILYELRMIRKMLENTLILVWSWISPVPCTNER